MAAHPTEKASTVVYAKRIVAREKTRSNAQKSWSYAKQQSTYKKSYSSNKGSSGQQKEFIKKTEPDYKRAIKVFGMAPPFTTAQLKKRRNELLRKYHPDQGVKNDTMAKEINIGFSVLIKLADR